MKKIPTIFERDPTNRARVLPKQNAACAWVFAGEGVATRKYDGTCCLMNCGTLYKRREVKPGKEPPTDFWEVDHDDVTGKTVGWVPVNMDANEDRWYAGAFDASMPNGTYELVGPKVQGNPEHFAAHKLIRHADAEVLDAPRDFNGLREWMQGRDIEGLVWHHEDGCMAKIKLRDFGIERLVTANYKIKERSFRRARCERAAEPRIKALRAGEVGEKTIGEMHDAVLRGDCPLCLESGFSSIGGHCRSMHGVRVRELRDWLGFTFTESICSHDLHERLAANNAGKNPSALGKSIGPRHLSIRGRQIIRETARNWLQPPREVKVAAGRKGGKQNKGKRPWNRNDAHGRYAMYQRGCHCQACHSAYLEYTRAAYQRRRNAQPNA